MDKTERKMTKIARELNKLTVQAMKEKGIGTAEFDFIHLVRHHPGITQAQLREELKIDKGAAARRAASLEAKGYLTRRDNPEAVRIPDSFLSHIVVPSAILFSSVHPFLYLQKSRPAFFFRSQIQSIQHFAKVLGF